MKPKPPLTKGDVEQKLNGGIYFVTHAVFRLNSKSQVQNPPACGHPL